MKSVVNPFTPCFPDDLRSPGIRVSFLTTDDTDNPCFIRVIRDTRVLDQKVLSPFAPGECLDEWMQEHSSRRGRASRRALIKLQSVGQSSMFKRGLRSGLDWSLALPG